MKRIIKEKMLSKFRVFLKNGEKSKATVSKYLCDIKKLMDYAGDREVDKSLVLSYKGKLLEEDGYKVSSVNSFLAAANCFFWVYGLA